MADSKVSALTEKTTIVGTEEILINDGGTSKKATVANVLAGGSQLSDLTIDDNKDWNGKNQTNHGGIAFDSTETGQGNKIAFGNNHSNKYIQHRSNAIEHSSFGGHRSLVWDGSAYSQAIRVSQKSNILISKNLSAVGTDGDTVLLIENGVVPSTSPANAIQLYAEDVSASSELKVRDEAGNITTLSPHDFDNPNFVVPRETSLDFLYRSENAMIGKGIAVNMSKLVRMVEKLASKVKELDPLFEIETLTNVYDLPTEPLDWDAEEEKKRLQREADKLEESKKEIGLELPTYTKKPRPNWLDLPTSKV